MLSRLVLSSPANGDAGTILSRQPCSVIEPGNFFGSMNMDDFMKNLWTAEDSKIGVGPLASSATENNAVNRHHSFSIPPALSCRTVEDVWRNIRKQSTADVTEVQPDHHHQHYQHQQGQTQHQYPQQRQATLGVMTLEDFLVSTGVVRDDPDAGSHTAESSSFYPSASTASVANGFSSTMDSLTPSLQHDWMNFRHSPQQHQQMLQQAEAVAAARRGFQSPSLVLPTGNPIYDGLAADNTVLGPEGFASSLALSPSCSDYSMQSRKRFPSEVVVEKTMERRQKRMIKNRESAARSRARKQAYTFELEAEITMLKEENARLKQQQASQTCIPDAVCSQSTKTRVLRRTQSF